MSQRSKRGAVGKQKRIESRSSNLRKWLNRPAVWLLGVLSAAATLATPIIFNETFKSILGQLEEPLSSWYCEFRRSPIQVDESQFLVLMSPLSGDRGGKHTSTVIDALRQDEGIRVARICTSLSYDDSKPSDLAGLEILNRAKEILRKNRADLILFGKVLVEGEAIKIWPQNEYGGCHARPQPTVLEHGSLGDEFNQSTKWQMITSSVGEIAAACRNTPGDWGVFAKRVQKIESFLERSSSNLTTEQLLETYQSYFVGLQLLYSNNQGDSWFSKAADSHQRYLKMLSTETTDPQRSELWKLLGGLLMVKAQKTSSADDRAQAIEALDEAIRLAPRSDSAFLRRGEAFFIQGDYDRAIKDFNDAIELGSPTTPVLRWHGQDYHEFAVFNEGNRPEALRWRGLAYQEQRHYDRAIKDFSEAIRLAPDDTLAYVGRGTAYLRNGELSLAITDYSKAIRLDPDHAGSLKYRGYASFYSANYDVAVTDLARAVRQKPDDAYSALMLHLARARAGGSDVRNELEANAAKLKQDKWPYTVVEMYLARRAPDSVLAAAGTSRERCQAQFYVGQWYLLRNERDNAIKLLKTAAESCPKDFVEHSGALYELQRLTQ
jgi:lipoprotein NlpI